MTQHRRRWPGARWWCAGLILRTLAALHGLLGGLAATQAAVSPSELVDRATLRVDLGTHHSGIAAVVASPDGRLLATGGNDRLVRLWDRQSGELVRTLHPPSQDTGAEGRIAALAFSPDGRWLAVSGETHYWDSASGRGGGVYLFDVGSGRLAQRLPGPSMNSERMVVFRLRFSADGRRLVALSGHGGGLPAGQGYLYEDPGTPRAQDGYLSSQNGIQDIDFAPDGRLLAIKGHGLAVYPAGSRRGEGETYFGIEALHDRTQPVPSYPQRLRVSPDGGRLAVAYHSPARIEIRDSRSLKLRAALNLSAGGSEDIRHLRWSPDGKSLYLGTHATGGGRPVGQLLQIRVDKKLSEIPLYSPQLALSALDVLADGSILVGDEQGDWTLLSPDGKPQLQPATHRLQVSDPGELYVSHDGSQIWLRYGPGDRDSLGFSLAQLAQQQRLDLGKPLPPELQAPRTEVPSGQRLSGWRHQHLVTLNGAGLNLLGEEPFSLALAHDQKSFLLGTNRSIRRFFFDPSTPRTGCPLPVSNHSELPSPCLHIPLPAAALAVNYTPDGKRIVAALADGSIRWFSAQDGSPELGFVLHRDLRRWVLWQPQGTYVASIGGAELIGWLVNPAQVKAATWFPLQHFAAKLYDPTRFLPSPQIDDLQTARMPFNEGGEVMINPGTAPAKPRYQPPSGHASDGQGALLRRLMPPVATILSPSDGTRVSDGQITLRVLVSSPIRQPIRGVRVLVNGKLDRKARGIIDTGPEPAAGSAPPGAAGGASPVADGGEVYSVPVLLPAGNSTIAVVAEGSAGASLPAILHVQSTAAFAPPVESRPRLWVLAVGVGSYASEALQLRYPAKDASDLVRVLKEQGPRLYQEVNVRVITDEQATLAGIRSGLTWLQSSLRPDDTALIFLAGHGVNETGSGQYLFLPRDVDMTRLSQTTLSAAELQQVLGSLPSRVLLFLDTCHSGNVLSGRRSRGASDAAMPSAPPAAPAAAQPERGDVTRFVGDLAGAEQGIVVMAASTGRQASQESAEWQNGAFTRALIEGLRGKADFRRTGRVTVNMLDLYVSERVRELTDGAQTPATAKPVTIPDFPVISLR